MASQLQISPALIKALPQFLADCRDVMPSEDFHRELRRVLLDDPTLTLRHVADILGVSRQRVGKMVDPLGRPSCATPSRPAPCKQEASRNLAQLIERVQMGQSAEQACRELGISLHQAYHLGFRKKKVNPSHGTAARSFLGCDCWRCRRASGQVTRRRQMSPQRLTQTLDWIAWRDPDHPKEGLTQVRIGELAGVDQPAVSRLVRKLENS